MTIGKRPLDRTLEYAAAKAYEDAPYGGTPASRPASDIASEFELTLRELTASQG